MTATILILLALGACNAQPRVADAPATLRIATYNGSLYDEKDRGLIERLAHDDEHARKIAAVIQRVRPDVLLLNEFDYDERGEAAELFVRDYLGRAQDGGEPIPYAHRYFAPVNTGVPSGLDIDRDGRTDGPADAWGFGHHPGQYGMLVLSRLPIDAARVRSFRLLPWSAMPGALAPEVDGKTYYDDATWKQLRLSSKSHWDVPLDTGRGTLHFLVHHPTPPVFDGPEDRNGRRNHDEIRLWADYVSGDAARSAYLVDDTGARGGLETGAWFVIAGDHNADPLDGDSWPRAIAQLLDSPAVRALPVPRSEGGVEAAARDAGANATQRGDPAHDTGGFSAGIGNLRVDYVLPSRALVVRDARVFWPRSDDPDAALVGATDHRLVYVDVELPN